MPKAKQNKGVSLPTARDGVYTPQEERMLDQITIEVTEAWAKDLTVMKKAFEKNKELSTLLNEMYHQVKARLGMIETFFDEDGKFKSFDDVLENQEIISSGFYKLELEIDKLKSATSKFCLSVKKETDGLSNLITNLCKKFDEFMDKSLELNKEQIEIQYKECELNRQLVELEEQRQKKWWKFWA